VYPYVLTHVDSTLTDLYIGFWSPAHDNLCLFKVSVLVPLEWGHQTLSCFGFSIYSYISCLCSPFVMWPKSNHIHNVIINENMIQSLFTVDQEVLFYLKWFNLFVFQEMLRISIHITVKHLVQLIYATKNFSKRNVKKC
jgi:hypothetical protein